MAKIFAYMAVLLYICQRNKHKTTKINDQRMKINEVIERHGMQLRDVSREMGMKPSALQSAIDRNLTVKTLRLIANAAKIPIAEFFLDELTEEEKQSILAVLQPAAAPASQPADKMGSAHEVSTEGKQSPDDLPFGKTSTVAEELQAVGAASPAAVPGALICPHCGKAMVISVASYEQK